jgi:EAL and modified HD-GYP domain-containing signal transduction protein
MTSEAQSVSALEIVVARQAIFDRDSQIVAYELLFRSAPQAHLAEPLLADGLMTANVLYSTVNIGIENLVGDKLMFCNADRDVLTGRIPMVLPPAQTVIEVLETVVCDDEVIDGCVRLAGLGYLLALDDFVWFEGAERLLELASIVKIDVLAYDEPGLVDIVARCAGYNVQLLAEKVETEAVLQFCLDLGFDYFQGYFLERPRNMSGKTLSGAQVGATRIASSLLSRDFEVAELEEILRTEPALAFQLLRLAGIGAHNGLRRRVRTLRDALVLVGPVRVQSWLALLMLRQQDGPASHHLVVALTRARMCEALVQRSQPRLSSLAYTAGMVSALDLLMGVDASEVSTALNLDDELYEAAFGCTSFIGRVVRDVTVYQRDPRQEPALSQLSLSDFDDVALKCLSWAIRMTSAVEDVVRPNAPAVRGEEPALVSRVRD